MCVQQGLNMKYLKNGFVYMGLTPQLKTLSKDFDDLSKSLMLDAIKRLVDLRNQDLSEKKFSTAQMAHGHHNLIDNELQKSDIAQNTSCKPGCAYCCEMDVSINSDEAELIHEFMKNHDITIDEVKLEKQSKFKGEWHDQTKEMRTCVFLGTDKLCKIYPVRPASCRKYLAKVDDIEECNLEHGVKDVRLAVSGPVEIITSAMFNMGEQGRLCQLMFKELKNGKNKI
jgi:Fe-S-cluster containining protein